jgi:hypothetical protein
MPYMDIRYDPAEIDPSQAAPVLQRVAKTVAAAFGISITSVQVELVPQNAYVLNRRAFDVRLIASYGRDDSRERQLPALAESLAEQLAEFCQDRLGLVPSFAVAVAGHPTAATEWRHSMIGMEVPAVALSSSLPQDKPPSWPLQADTGTEHEGISPSAERTLL